jgi:putative oxidoreductase
MNPNITNSAALAGRILLAVLFMISGFGKITGWDGTAGYMASKGMPMVPVFLALTIAMELGGGVLLAIGFKVRWVAAAFVLFLIPVTFIFHPPGDATQQINFLKNLAIMGGMLMVVANGAGAYSVDRK